MATTDILSLGEAQDALKLVGSVGPLVAAWVEAASDAVDDLCGPVVIRTITDELHDGGFDRIFPKYSPVATVSTLFEYNTAGTSTTLTAETYASKAASGYLIDGPMILRRSSGSRATFAAGNRNVKLTYTAGRYATTAAVSERFKRACAVIVSHLWGLEHGTGNSTFGAVGDGQVFTPSGFAIPRRAVELLGREVQTRVAVA